MWILLWTTIKFNCAAGRPREVTGSVIHDQGKRGESHTPSHYVLDLAPAVHIRLLLHRPAHSCVGMWLYRMLTARTREAAVQIALAHLERAAKTRASENHTTEDQIYRSNDLLTQE